MTHKTTITIEALKALQNDDGMTLKNGRPVNFKTGYQVATEGIETTDAAEAFEAITKTYGGSCGVWYSGGVYYVDKSHRVSTLRDALNVGRACNQISILKWSDMSLVYC